MKRILVPCDFSKEAVNALRSALEFGKKDNALVHILHVIELPVVHDAVLMPVVNYEETLLDELKDKAELDFKVVLSQFPDDQERLIHTVSFGPVSKVILSYISERDIDLVVMGTKGVDGIREVLIGSNTEKIVRASQAPVLVVREQVEIGKVKSIVFPTNVDFVHSETLMTQVKKLQMYFGARLHLVWVNTPTNFADDLYTYKKLNEFAHRFMLTNYTVNVFNDSVEESGIIHFAHHIKADMLVMATHGRKGLSHVFAGSITEDVVNHIDLPVWTIGVSHKEAQVVFE
jgi:nucleotide-binding universal stress UspA family protein